MPNSDINAIEKLNEALKDCAIIVDTYHVEGSSLRGYDLSNTYYVYPNKCFFARNTKGLSNSLERELGKPDTKKMVNFSWREFVKNLFLARKYEPQFKLSYEFRQNFQTYSTIDIYVGRDDASANALREKYQPPTLIPF